MTRTRGLLALVLAGSLTLVGVAARGQPETQELRTTEAAAPRVHDDPVPAVAGRELGTTTTTTVAPPPPPTTTTTTAPPPVATTTTTQAPPPPTQVSGGHVNGYPCGGDLPPCFVLARESGGDPLVWNGGCYDGPCPGGSTASGLWQFLSSTWAGYAGYAAAAHAPVAVQNEKARALWDGGRGCSHWAAC